MITHDLIQGSPEWHAHRLTHFNASDAPAMMGVSPYETRSELLHRLYTGITKEVDAATQRRFDDGHRFEALARPLAKNIIGQTLYPVTGSEGKLSASFDGLTIDDAIGFEHKSLNNEIAGAFASCPEPGDMQGDMLPMHYQVQCEQQCMVSGCEKILFLASRWNSDTLDQEVHCWYHPNPELAAKIKAGWEQFEIDLANYVPPVVVAAPVAKPVASLPVVFDMRVEGRLVACNVEQYKPAALAYIEAINTNLINDQDFADADANAKFCRDSADKLELAVEQVMGQMGDINQALNAVREIAAAFDAKGLALEKLVKAEKENRKNAIVAEAADEFAKHIKSLDDRLGRGLMPEIVGNFGGVIKGLKSIDSMRDKVATELARVKIEANAVADRITANLKAIEQANSPALFADKATLVLKQADDLAAIIANRLAAEQQRQEAERERIRLEEAAKLAREAEAKAQAEAARMKAEAEELARQDHAKRAQAVAAIKFPQPELRSPEPVASLPEPAHVASVEPKPLLAAVMLEQTDIQRMRTLKDDSNDPWAGCTEKITTAELGNRLGFPVQAALIESLGFTGEKVKAAMCWPSNQTQAIGFALAERIRKNVTTDQKAKAA